MKARQDKMVFDLHRRGVPSYILCPGNIGGPYSPFVVGLADKISKPQFPLVDGGRYATNLVHVDNLVEAIVTAIRSDVGAGERYFVNDERIEWHRFVEDLASIIGIEADCRSVSRQEVVDRAVRVKPSAGFTEHVRVAMSGEFRRGMSMLPIMAGVNRLAKQTFDALPVGVQKNLRRRVQGPRKIRPVSASVSLDDGLVRVQTRRVYHSPVKIRERLGYRPIVTYERGLETTAAWLRFFGITRKAEPVAAG
jgi:nucleoside-diphosphate-sugar epimerase